jgi:hypothetical protein
VVKQFGVLVLWLAGCGESEEAAYRARILTSSVKSVLEAPDSVKILRLHPGPHPKTEKKIASWADVPTTAEVVADGATAQELSKLLLDERSYPLIGKGCIPQPGVKIRFQRGPTTIDALLCFECLMIAYFGQGAFGNQAVWGDFDPIASKLSAIAKKAFPHDEVIQSIKY